MKKLDPSIESTRTMFGYMLSAIGPRPIAFASTIDNDGNKNLSPFSFFNVFSSNPPILVFSPARRGKDASTKDTFENVKATKEVVINVVTEDIVHQMNLASTEYDTATDEFVRAGFTPIASEHVKPYRVKESPVHFECKVNDIIQLGEGGGAGNLVICQVLMMHVDESVLNELGNIDPNKLKLVARMGASFYSKGFGDALFEINKPTSNNNIGIDGLPGNIKNSTILTGNDLGQLGCLENLPSSTEIATIKDNADVKAILDTYSNDDNSRVEALHNLAKQMIKEGKIDIACRILMV